MTFTMRDTYDFPDPFGIYREIWFDIARLVMVYLFRGMRLRSLETMGA